MAFSFFILVYNKNITIMIKSKYDNTLSKLILEVIKL